MSASRSEKIYCCYSCPQGHIDIVVNELLLLFFKNFAVESPSRDSGGSVVHDQEMETFSSAQTEEHLELFCNSHNSLSESSTPATSSPPIHDAETRGSSEDPSQRTHALIESSQASPNGISIFKGYGFFYMVFINIFHHKLQTCMRYCVLS